MTFGQTKLGFQGQKQWPPKFHIKFRNPGAPPPYLGNILEEKKLTPCLRTKSELYIFRTRHSSMQYFCFIFRWKGSYTKDDFLPLQYSYIIMLTSSLVLQYIWNELLVVTNICSLWIHIYDEGGCSSISIERVSYQVLCRTFQNRHLKNTWSTSGAGYHLNFQAGIHEVCHFLFHTFHHLEWHEITIKN